MLGEGIVSLGVTPSETWSRRNEKASPKIVSEIPSRPSTFSAAGVKSSSPSAFLKCTFRLSEALLIPSSA